MRVGWGAVALLLLAGCADGPDGCVPPVSAANGPDGASASGGADDVPIHVRIQDARDGRPLPGARLAVAWNRDFIQPPEDAGDTFPDAPVIVLLYLQADSSGVVKASIPYDRYSIGVAWKEGYTEEWTPLQTPRRVGMTWTIELYPDHLGLLLNDTYPGPVAAPDIVGQESWRPSEFIFAPNPAVGAAMKERLVNVDVRLDWTYTLPEQADFALWAGPDAAQVRATTSSEAYTDDGPHSVSLQLDVSKDFFGDEHWPELGDMSLWAGPVVRYKYVSVAGVPFSVQVNMTFDHRAMWLVRCGGLFSSSAIEPYDPENPLHNPQEPPRAPTGRQAPAAAFPGFALALLASAAVAARRRARPAGRNASKARASEP